MTAKGTVLRASECLERSYDWDTSGGYKEEAVDNLLLEQAEITWKARQLEIDEARKDVKSMRKHLLWQRRLFWLVIAGLVGAITFALAWMMVFGE